MGLSSLPAPSEGVLCVLLVNTAISFSIFKGLVRTILHIVGLSSLSSSASPSSPPSSQPSDFAESNAESFEPCRGPSFSYIDEFRSRIPAILFKEATLPEPEHECSVCLSHFELQSEINHLPCGHIFHKVCLEKWLDYWNITCPLCRTPLMPEEEISCFW